MNSRRKWMSHLQTYCLHKLMKLLWNRSRESIRLCNAHRTIYQDIQRFTADLDSKLDRLCNSLETSINKAMSCSTHTDLSATRSVADVLHRDRLNYETSIQDSSPQRVHRPSVHSISRFSDSTDMNETMDNNWPYARLVKFRPLTGQLTNQRPAFQRADKRLLPAAILSAKLRSWRTSLYWYRWSLS